MSRRSTETGNCTDEGAECPSPVAQLLLLRDAELPEGSTRSRQHEVGVVAKPTHASRLLHNHTRRLSPSQQRLSAIDVRRYAHVARPAICCTAQRLNQQRVIRIVQRLAAQIGSPAPPLAPHA